MARWKEDFKGRLFIIRHSPIDPDAPAGPEEFKDILGFSFYRHEDENDPSSFAFTLGEHEEKPDQTYFVLVQKVAQAIAQKLEKIEQDRRLNEQITPVPILPAPPAQPHVNLLVVAPKDMGSEA